MHKPSAVLLPDRRRLHLQHGPIDLIIEAHGRDRLQAYEAATTAFQTVLKSLIDELPQLRQPTSKGRQFEGAIARRMQSAVEMFLPRFSTPMAAVAGAVADHICTVMRKGLSLDKLYVNNGGDGAFFITPGETMKIALAGAPGGYLTLDWAQNWRGAATSGWQGRSHSLGIADSVTVIAEDAATADCAATLIANAVDLPGHPAISRIPARQIAPDSDLKDKPVTVSVETLAPCDRSRALDAGERLAKHSLAGRKIAGAVLSLQGELRIIGLENEINKIKKVEKDDKFCLA